MKWYEYIIAFVAICLVILPIFLNKKLKKSGKSTCGCKCSNCNKDCPLKK